MQLVGGGGTDRQPFTKRGIVEKNEDDDDDTNTFLLFFFFLFFLINLLFVNNLFPPSITSTLSMHLQAIFNASPDDGSCTY